MVHDAMGLHLLAVFMRHVTMLGRQQRSVAQQQLEGPVLQLWWVRLRSLKHSFHLFSALATTVQPGES